MKSKITKIVVVLLALVTVAQLCLVGCNLDNNGDNGDKFTIVSKSVYMRGEEIVLTASGDGDDWVGVYREKDDVKQVDPIASYKVYADGFLSGQSYIVQRSATFYDSRQAFKDFPAVKYKVVLFGDATKTKVLKTEYFSVADKDLTVPTAPTKLAYKQALPGSGFCRRNADCRLRFGQLQRDGTRVVLGRRQRYSCRLDVPCQGKNQRKSVCVQLCVKQYYPQRCDKITCVLGKQKRYK